MITFIVVEYTDRTSNVSYRLDGEFSEKSSQKIKMQNCLQSLTVGLKKKLGIIGYVLQQLIMSH